MNGTRYNLPPGKTVNDIPATDSVGDALQAAARSIRAGWTRARLRPRERATILRLHGEGRHWLANLLQKQAQGRYVERLLRRRFPGLQWHRQGVDAVDPATGLIYEVLSGTTYNVNLHAKRMPHILYRLITF